MSIDGTWIVTVDSPTGKQDSTLEVQARDSVLTGTQSGGSGSGPIKDGKLDGDSISWSASINIPIPLTLEFKGIVTGDAMSGRVKAGMFGTFDFTGSRV